MMNRPIGLDEIERAMTDNTPRPETMSRESVLAVLDNVIKFCSDPDVDGHTEPLRQARAAVAALYDRCEALEQGLKDVVDPIGKMRRDLPPGYKLDGGGAVTLANSVETYKRIAREALAGTEASDAEGGG